MKSSSLRICYCLFVVALLSGCGASDEDPANVVVGNRVPQFSLKALDGTTVTSNSLKGSPVILNFWATWCQPCMTEIPDLKQVAANGKVKVVGIALDEGGLQTIKPFVDSNNMNYTVLVGDEEIFRRFNGVGIPYTLVLDSSLRIVKIYRGPTTKESLEADLRAMSQGS